MGGGVEVILWGGEVLRVDFGRVGVDVEVGVDVSAEEDFRNSGGMQFIHLQSGGHVLSSSLQSEKSVWRAQF